MGYSIAFRDPRSGEVCEMGIAAPRGGMYCTDGDCRFAELYVTYNYAKLFREVGGVSMIRHDDDPPEVKVLDGMNAAECVAALSEAIPRFDGEPADDYWEPCEGNCRKALANLLVIACNVPANSICEVS